MSTEQGSVIRGEPLWKNFTMIPNLVADLHITNHAFRLYFVICRTIGNYNEGDKVCFKTARTLAKESHQSMSTVAMSKKELRDAGLITIETSDGQHYKTNSNGEKYRVGGVGSDVISLVNVMEPVDAFKPKSI